MVVIKSISHYVEQVVLNSIPKEQSKFNFKLVNRSFYRGHSDVEYELIPSIARAKEHRECNLNYEVEMINRAQLRNPHELSSISNRINLLARLQHHELETRLLDITENALIALYFACSKNPDKNGEVINFEVGDSKVYKPYMIRPKLYSQFSKLVSGKKESFKIVQSVLNDPENQDVVTKLGRGDFEGAINDEIKKGDFNPIVIEHEIHSEREVRQQAAFLLFSNVFNPTENCFESRIDKIEKTHDLIREIFEIPKDLKQELLRGLMSFGITEEFIFPEFHNRCKSINDSIRTYCSDITPFRDATYKTSKLFDGKFKEIINKIDYPNK